MKPIALFMLALLVAFAPARGRARPTYTDADVLTHLIHAAHPTTVEEMRNVFQSSPDYSTECFISDREFRAAKRANGEVDPADQLWEDYNGALQLSDLKSQSAFASRRGHVQFHYQRDGREGIELTAAIDWDENDTPFLASDQVHLSCLFDDAISCRFLTADLSKHPPSDPKNFFDPKLIADKKYGQVESKGKFAIYVVAPNNPALIMRLAAVVNAEEPGETMGYGPFEHPSKSKSANYILRYVCSLTLK